MSAIIGNAHGGRPADIANCLGGTLAAVATRGQSSGAGRWLEARGRVWAWWLVLAAVALAPVVFDTGTADVFNLTKLTLITVLVVPAAALVLVSRPRPRPPVPRAAVPVAVFAAVTALATALSINPLTSLIGAYQRYNGLLTLLVDIAAAAVVVACAWDRAARIRELAFAILAGATVLAAYVTVQATGHDYFAFRDAFGNPDPFPGGGMGNSNFAGGYLAITLPLWTIPILRPPAGRARLARRAAAAGTALGAVALWLTESRGGLVAALAAAVALAVLHRGRVPRAAVVGTVAAAAIVVVVAVVVVWHPFMDDVPSPLEGIGVLRTESVDIRGEQWRAAVSMIADRPVLGSGPESYVALASRHRSPEAGAAEGLLLADKPHNLLLETGVASGLVGIAALVAVYAVVLRGAVRTRATADETDVALVAALAAYLVQAQFSIDVPALALVGWLLVAALVVRTDPQVVAARAAVERASTSKRSRPKPTARAPERLVGVPRPVVVGTVGLVAAALVAVAVQPYFADRDAGTALRLAADDDATVRDVAGAWRAAIERHPWESTYRLDEGIAWERAALAATDPQQVAAYAQAAAASYGEAERLRPGTALVAARRANTATLLARAGAATFDEAEAAWQRALDLDPYDWEVHNGYALMLVSWANAEDGDLATLERAERELEVTVYIRNDQADVWANLAQVRGALGDDAGADEAQAAADEISRRTPPRGRAAPGLVRGVAGTRPTR